MAVGRKSKPCGSSRTIPLALFALTAIYRRATPALLILGSLAGTMLLLDAGIGLFERDLGKCAGPLLIAALQFLVVYLLHRSLRGDLKKGAITYVKGRRSAKAWVNGAFVAAVLEQC
jgi:hypothetical protein